MRLRLVSSLAAALTLIQRRRSFASASRTKNPVCRAASLDCAQHRIVPSYDIRHLEKYCGAEGDSASNINLVEEPTQHKVRRQVRDAT